MRGSRVLRQPGVAAAVVAIVGTVAVGLAGAAGASGGAVANHTVYAVDDGGTLCFSTVPNDCPTGSTNVDVPISGAGAGDTVIFDFSDMYNPPGHNAASRGTNWSFTTGPVDNPHVPNPDRRTFTQNGDYEFVCDAHAVQMTGTIHVTGGTDATPSTTPSATATPTPTPTVTTPTPTPTPDVERPTLRRLDLAGSRHAVRVRFRLSESATVTIRVRRGRRVVTSVTRQVAAGQRSLRVRSSRLRRGRYKIEVRARDASGNVSTLASKSLRIRR